MKEKIFSIDIEKRVLFNICGIHKHFMSSKNFEEYFFDISVLAACGLCTKKPLLFKTQSWSSGRWLVS